MHVVGYSLSVCEFVSFIKKQSDLPFTEEAVIQTDVYFESDRDLVSVTFTFFVFWFNVFCLFFVIQGSFISN